LRLRSASQLGNDLKKPVQVSESGAVLVDKLLQHEFAIQEFLLIFRDFFGHTFQELGLDARKRVGRFATGFGQMRVGFFPLLEFGLPLLLHLIGGREQLFQKLILFLLVLDHLARQGHQRCDHQRIFRAVGVGCVAGCFSRNVDPEHRRKILGVLRHCRVGSMPSRREVYKVGHHPRGWRPVAHHFLIVLCIIRSKKSRGVGNFHFVPLDLKVGGPAVPF